ncbi:hypothetical protein [Spirosoma rigui]|uniref:hypothetical protein n=1 Tax=Spirosoma rigui TaxID=564064 RepID=UPI0009B104F8|nr:hypothetical protein [Spirosoma rigui]
MTTFMHTLDQRNEPLYLFGLVCLAGGFLCLVLTRFTRATLMGANVWYKPFKFFLSTAIFVWSMAWYMAYLNDVAAVTWYSWGVIGLLGFENLYITVQAARGQLSHFNISTPWYAGMYRLMALAAVATSVWTAYIGFLFFGPMVADVPLPYLWGIRLGIMLFVIFSMQGLAMGARMAHTVGGTDDSPGLPVVNWSRKHGDLRISHFMGMHALQCIPLLSVYLLNDVAVVVATGLVYGLLTATLFVRALRGKPLPVLS